MRWTEEVSTIAARRIFPSASWSSAAIDSLTFKTAVQLGEVVYVRAAVLKVYDSSVEVAAIVTCEDRNSAQPKVRQVSESFLTLVRRSSPAVLACFRSRSRFSRPYAHATLVAALAQVAIDPASGRPLKGVLRQVQLPDGPVRDMAASAEQRRRDRLLDKRVLQRCVRPCLSRLTLRGPEPAADDLRASGCMLKLAHERDEQ